MYPLARNQYINNSPEIFSCIRPGVNTCAACICTEINSPKIFVCIGTRHVRIQAQYQYRGQRQSANTFFKKNSSKIFSCIRTSANTGPTCIRAKINSSRIFSCMYRFCAGGYCESRRRTNVQQLTCNIDLSRSFYCLFFSFVLIELKPFVLKGKVPGQKL